MTFIGQGDGEMFLIKLRRELIDYPHLHLNISLSF